VTNRPHVAVRLVTIKFLFRHEIAEPRLFFNNAFR
jgi:hypothetical protein